MSLNSITLGGNVGNDCETRFTSNGKAIGSFSLAVQQGYGDNKRAMWVTCLILGDRATKLAEHIRKGDHLVVSGRLDVRDWEGQDGRKNKSVEVVVSEIEFMSGNKRSDQNQNRQREQQQQYNQDNGEQDYDQDIPF
ncbi:single-stranded DNA-binding protein [Escherichia coli]|nr:single-stranded DNA-binding protein [Escherichia coli]